jgi:ribosomal protein S18 acetylase RimI-like enzyme
MQQNARLAVHVLSADDWERFRTARLAALETSPEAFGSTFADWRDAGEARWRDRLSAMAYNIVVSLDGADVGLASGTAIAGGATDLRSLWVAPGARGAGVGEALVEAVAAWAVRHGARELTLSVRVGNEPALALYRRLGFADTGPGEVAPGAPPERRMRRPLGASGDDSASAAEAESSLDEGGGGGAEHLVPFVHVADVERSAEFYAHFGFVVRNTYDVDGVRVWCWLQRGEARLMLARADAPVGAGRQAVLFYLYVSDLEGLHARLVAAGARPGPIGPGAPGPDREFRIDDPDGYCLMVTDQAAVTPPG